jgi:hypothetical protein
MCHSQVCASFSVHSHASCACVIFPVFLDGACACAPCIVIAHPDFITGCIVLDLLEILFGNFGPWVN